MPKIKKIHHVAIVVNDLAQSIALWQEALGIELNHIEEVPSQQSKVAFFPVYNGEIELVQPTTEDSGIAKFLAQKGPGMHHLCFEVDDIVGMIERLKSKNIRLINEIPIELEGRKAAFIHPKSADGVLIELYQTVNT